MNKGSTSSYTSKYEIITHIMLHMFYNNCVIMLDFSKNYKYNSKFF